jgi:parallel beta-helix repeat protein
LHGISLSNGANNNTVSNNVAFGNANAVTTSATGILVYASSDNTIIHNTTYGNQDTGLSFLDGSSGNRIIGNLTYGNGDHGIDNNNSPDNIIVGNTVHGNVTAGINLEGSTGSGGATVRNNILMDNGLRKQEGGVAPGKRGNIAVDGPSTSGTSLDYNEYYLTPSEGGTIQVTWNVAGVYTSLNSFRAAVPGQEINGIEGTPLFAGPAPIAVRSNDTIYTIPVNQGDYHILPGSKAIDSADSNAPYEPTLDIAGKPRVDDPATPNTGAGTRLYDDRGVYEFQLWGTLQQKRFLPFVLR